MARKRSRGRRGERPDVHAVFPPADAARLRAFAGFHGRDLSDVLLEGARLVMRGFSARQEGPRLAAGTEAAPEPAEGAGAAGAA